MNYNTSVPLWESKRQSLLSCPNGGELIRVRNGHILGSLEILARFSSDDEAKETLRLAGFHETERGWKA